VDRSLVESGASLPIPPSAIHICKPRSKLSTQIAVTSERVAQVPICHMEQDVAAGLSDANNSAGLGSMVDWVSEGVGNKCAILLDWSNGAIATNCYVV